MAKKSIDDLQAQYERIRKLGAETGDMKRVDDAYNIGGRMVRNIVKYQQRQRENAMANGRPIPWETYGSESREVLNAVPYNRNTRMGLNYK